jgi:hypothetical protein
MNSDGRKLKCGVPLPPGRGSAAVLVCLLALATASCRGRHSRLTVQNEEPDAGQRMESTVRMGDPGAAGQLLSGFWAMEDNSWRWTARRFSIQLRTPPAAAQLGGALTLELTIPEVVIRKLRNITITASINGAALKSAEFESPGPYVFAADVPASMLTADSVKVDFALDKSVPPGADKRELGIIAKSVSISPR